MPCLPNAPPPNRARLWLAEEDVYGVYTTDPDLAPVRLPFLSESLGEDREAPGVYHTIERGSRPAGYGQIGSASVGGEVQTEFCLNGWGPLLVKHAFGAEYLTGEGVTYPHSGQCGELPVGLTIDKGLEYRDGTWFIQRFLGCKIRTLTMRTQLGRPTELRAQFIGRERIEHTSPVSGERYARGDLVVPGDRFSVLIDRDLSGAAVRGNVVSAEWTLDNGLTPRRGVEGDGLLDGLELGSRVISGRVEAMFRSDDEAWIDRWLDNDEVEVAFQCAHAAQHPTIEAAFTFPACIIRGSPVPRVGGRGAVRIDFTFQAAFSEASSTEGYWAIRNQESAISTSLVTRVP